MHPVARSRWGASAIWRMAGAADPTESLMRVTVVGLGIVGRRLGDHLDTDPDVGWVGRTRDLPSIGTDVVVLAGPAPHAADAARAIRSGIHVVSTSDDREDTSTLVRLDGLARRHERTLVVGAAAAPG